MRGRLRLLGIVLILLLAGVFLGSAVSQWLGDADGPPSSGSAGRRQTGERVRVEVLNAGGVAGRAGEATDALRDAGFDVVFFGNATSFDRDSSVVFDRVGELDLARAVADVLGIRNVRSEPDANLYLDVTVLIGREWAPVVRIMGVEEAPERAWWDPRGWFGR